MHSKYTEEAITLADSVINYINFQFLANADILRDQLKESGKIDDSDVNSFNMMMKEPFKKQIGRLRKMKRLLLLMSSESEGKNFTVETGEVTDEKQNK